MKWIVLLSVAFFASSASGQGMNAPVIYAELGGPSALSAGLEFPIAQTGTSSVFVRGGVGFVPRVFEGGAIGTVPLGLGLAVPLSDQAAVEGIAGGVATFGDTDAADFLLHGGAGLRFGLGRAVFRVGAAVLADPSSEPEDGRFGVVPSLAAGFRL